MPETVPYLPERGDSTTDTASPSSSGIIRKLLRSTKSVPPITSNNSSGPVVSTEPENHTVVSLSSSSQEIGIEKNLKEDACDEIKKSQSADAPSTANHSNEKTMDEAEDDEHLTDVSLTVAEEEVAHINEIEVRRRRIRYVTTGLIVLSVILMLVIITLLIQWHGIRVQRYHTAKVTTPTMCIANSDIPVCDSKTNFTVPPDVTGITLADEYLYCGDLGLMITWLSGEALECFWKDGRFPTYNHYHEVIPSNCKESDKVPSVIKLSGIDVEKTQEFRGPDSVVYWKNVDILQSSGLEYLESDGRLVVKESGQFYMSSHIMLKSNGDSMYIKQSLTLFRNGKNEVVMTKEEEICQIDGTFEREMVKTSTMAAHFELERNDVLYVTVSHSKYLINYGSLGHHFIAYDVHA